MPGRDRRFDILAAPGPRIALPFAPFRDHCTTPRNAKIFAIDCAGTNRPRGTRLCCNLNTLHEQMPPHQHNCNDSAEIRTVTDLAPRPPLIVAQCCRLAAPPAPAGLRHSRSITKSRPLARGSRRLPDARSGRKIAALQNNKTRRRPHAEQSPDRPIAAPEMRRQGNSRRRGDGGHRQRDHLPGRVRQTRPRPKTTP